MIWSLLNIHSHLCYNRRTMPEKKHTIQIPGQEPQTVTVRRDRRLKRSARWQREPDGSLLLRIPYRMPATEIPGLLGSIQKQLLKQKKQAARRTDADLQARAAPSTPPGSTTASNGRPSAG